MGETKKSLREKMLSELAELSDKDRMNISKQLQEQLFQTDLWKNAETIGIYLSFGTEWDTRAIVKEAYESGKNVAIPKTIPQTKEMDFYVVTDESQVKKGHFDIEEPIVEKATYIDKDKIDLLIVPGLIFSKDGYRIGFGGGYYDRFLTDFIHPTVSLVSRKQLKENIPINEYDIPVHYIITEDEILS